MTLPRHLLPAVLLLLQPQLLSAADAVQPPIVPERGVIISGPGQPDWMEAWQRARRLVRMGEKEQAVEEYTRLLGERPLLEAARWEQCRLLQSLGRMAEAVRCVELLLQRNDTPEYRLVAGQLALQQGHFAAAAQAFGRVLEQQPQGADATVARQGLAESLRGQGQRRLSMALEEPLLADPVGHGALRGTTSARRGEQLNRLLDDALALQDADKSRRLLQGLADITTLSEPRLQSLLALLHPEEGVAAQQAGDDVLRRLLQEQLRRHPQQLQSRLQLATLLQVEPGTVAARQALAVLQQGVSADHKTDPALLLATAGLAAGRAARPEVALTDWQQFLQRGLGSRAQRKRVQKQMSRLLNRLAGDFLVIVENAGPAPLWRDLQRFGSHRQEIFLRMAERLIKRSRNRDYSLASDLLNFVRSRAGHSPQLARRLSTLFQRMKRWQEALAALRAVPRSSRRAGWFQEQAHLQSTMGNELAAAESWRSYLKLKPEAQQIRRRALLLFARLGMVKEQKELFSWWLQQGDVVELQTVLLQLYWLGRNRQMDAVADVASWAAGLWRHQPQKLVALRLAEAEAASRNGAFYQAELQLRETLNLRTRLQEVVMALALNAARAGRGTRMQSWLDALAELPADSCTLSPQDQQAAVAFLRSRLALTRREKSAAQQAFASGVETLAQTVQTAQESSLARTLLAEVCAAPWNGGAVLTQSCRQAARRFKISLQPPGAELFQRLPATAPSRQLAQGRELVQQRKFELALPLLTSVLKQVPDSLSARLLLAEAEMGRGQYSQAENQLSQLEGEEYDNTSICRLQLRLDRDAGEYTTALKDFHRCWGPIESEGGSSASDEQLALNLFTGGQPEEAAELAQLLWSAERHRDALSVYRAILDQPLLRTVTTRLRQNPTAGSESFWSFLRSDTSSEEESLQALLAPSLLLKNLGSGTGVLLARSSRRLDFQLRLLKEYDARIATWERHYLYAEKRYRDLLAEEGGVQTMADLAALYKRMGQYHKEARLYRRMERRGTVTKPLTASMEDNSRRIAPETGMEMTLHRLDGEQGRRNVVQAGYGLTGSFTHEQDKEIKVSYDSRRFHTLHGESDSLNSNRLGSAINWQPWESTELALEFGVDRIESGGINLLTRARGEMQLNEQVSGFAEFYRSEITDTLQAISDRILDNSFVTGVEIQTPVGIGLGGDLRYTQRSDNNNGQGLHGWLGWSRFHEESRWELRWDSLFSTNSHSGESYHYWTPATWNRQLMSARWQYHFGAGSDAGYGGSHVGARLGFGLDEGNSAVSTAGVDIFVEINRHFLLKSNFDFTRSSECDESSFQTSLQYRW